MDKLENLKRFITAIATGDDTVVEEAFRAYSKTKSQDILKRDKRNILESMKRMQGIMAQLLEFSGDNSIQLEVNGNVLIKGKLVGRVSVDLEDMDSGINFTSADGRFSKEFEDNEELFKYLSAQYAGETL